jgi:hypothetical protein
MQGKRLRSWKKNLLICKPKVEFSTDDYNLTFIHHIKNKCN